MRSCGDKPELVAIGVAPLGIISIGVVPMGVVNACVVGMGVLVAGLHAMGLWTISPQPHRHHGAAHRGAVQALAYRDPEQARARALALGCTGVHRMGSLWMPCATHP